MSKPTLKTHDLSPTDYRAALKDFLPTVGLKAEAYTSIDTNGATPYSVALYAQGISQRNGGYFRLGADTLGDLLIILKTKWAEYEAQHRAETIRSMALAVIRITADLGECTDAALRNCGEFDARQIRSYGEEACVEANFIAGKGPFTIIVKGGSNVEAA